MAGLTFGVKGGWGVGEFSRLGNEQMFWWAILFTWFCLPFNKFKYPYFSFIKCEVIMVNYIACQKQGAPNQKSKLEVSRRECKKELTIINEKVLDHLSNLQIKSISREVPWKWLTPRPYFCLYGIMVEYSNLWVQIPSCHLYLKFVSVTYLLVCFVTLNDGTCETRKHVFYFVLKAFLILEIITF